MAEAWAGQIDAGEWWRDPDLTLPDLARRLGTNTHALSRALNEGRVNFARFVNGRRVHCVAAALYGAPMTCSSSRWRGFNSKASFNRAFRDVFAQSPSEYRRATAQHRNLRAQSGN